MAVLGGFRRRLAGLISPETNLFNGAFFGLLGSGYTSYDVSAASYIERGYAYNPDVYAIIQQQSVKHASIPKEVKLIEDEAHKRALDRLRMQTKGGLTPSQHIKKLSLEKKAYKEDYLAWPLEKPNPIQSWEELFALEKLFLRVTGNVFYYDAAPEEGMNKGVPIFRYILPSHQMQIVLKEGAGQMDFYDVESPVDHYILVEGNKYITFPAEQITHIKYTNPLYDQEGTQLYGLSPLKAALRNINASNSALDHNLKTIQNGGTFGFVHTGNNVITKEQADELKDRLLEMDSGGGRLDRIAGSALPVEFTKIGLNTDELKPFDYLKHDQKALCNVLGWSTILLNTDEKGDFGGTIKEERKRVLTDNIMPDNSLLNAGWEAFIRKFKGYENAVVESCYDDLPEMQEDQETLMNWIGKAIDIGIMSRNEGREALKLVRIEDENMDVITVKDDVIPLEEALLDNFNTIQNG